MIPEIKVTLKQFVKPAYDKTIKKAWDNGANANPLKFTKPKKYKGHHNGNETKSPVKDNFKSIDIEMKVRGKLFDKKLVNSRSKVRVEKKRYR